MKEMPRWHTGRPGTRHPHPGGAVLLQPCALVLTRAKFMPSLMEEETSHGLLETGPMPQRVLKLAHSDPKLPVPSIQPALPPKAQASEGRHVPQGGPRQKQDRHPSIAISDRIESIPPPRRSLLCIPVPIVTAQAPIPGEKAFLLNVIPDARLTLT